MPFYKYILYLLRVCQRNKSFGLMQSVKFKGCLYFIIRHVWDLCKQNTYVDST